MVVGDRVVAPKPPGGEFPNHRPGNKVSLGLYACEHVLYCFLPAATKLWPR